MGDAIKGFREINCHCCGSCGGSRLIKTLSNGHRQWQESRGCVVGRFETILCRMGGRCTIYLSVYLCTALPVYVLVYSTTCLCTVLYYLSVYCTILPVRVLYCTTWLCTVLYYLSVYCTVLYVCVLYCTTCLCTILPVSVRVGSGVLAAVRNFVNPWRSARAKTKIRLNYPWEDPFKLL